MYAKGGVGKSTIAVNLARQLTAQDHDVLLMDLDPNGHVSVGLGFDEQYYSTEETIGNLFFDDADPASVVYDTCYEFDILHNSDLSGVDLLQADLVYADLSGANLSFADLTGSDFSDAKLSNGNLKTADPTSADFTGTDLSDENLTDAIGDFMGATHDLDDKDTEQIRTDLRSSMNMLINELTEDGCEHDSGRLSELETEARVIADYAGELALRYRHDEDDE